MRSRKRDTTRTRRQVPAKSPIAFLTSRNNSKGLQRGPIGCRPGRNRIMSSTKSDPLRYGRHHSEAAHRRSRAVPMAKYLSTSMSVVPSRSDTEAFEGALDNTERPTAE